MSNRWSNQIKSAICRFPDCPETKIYCRHYCRTHYEYLWRNRIPFDTHPIRKVLGTPDRELGETPYQPGERWTRDELMAEWDFMRGWVPFEEFGARVGIKQDSWKQAFRRAKAAGDPRARLAACDVSTWSDPASWTASYCDSTSRERARQRRARQKQGAAA